MSGARALCLAPDLTLSSPSPESRTNPQPRIPSPEVEWYYSPPMTTESPGAWLFRYRSSLPVPLALILLLVRKGQVDARWVLIIGPLLAAVGEGVRLWAVRHIG